MPDKFSKEVRSQIMASIKQKNTKIEILVFRELRKRGIYFQKHHKKIIGTPDVALPRKKIAIFIDGDFWHGFRYPIWKNRLSSKYWRKKIERNRERDKQTFLTLRKQGWKVLRVWEHELSKNFDNTISKIVTFLDRNMLNEKA